MNLKSQVVDCPDASDEANCSYLELKPSYNSEYPSLDTSRPIQLLAVSFKITRIYSVKDVAMTFSVDLFLEVEWLDAGVTYINLNEDVKLNGLTKRDMNAIWTPAMEFTNSLNRSTLPIDEKVAVLVKKLTAGSYRVKPDNINEGTFFEGSENPLLYRRKFDLGRVLKSIQPPPMP